MSATPVLALRDVSKSFGSIEVLHGVTLALEPGTVHALIGENGAGKSTTMKIMAGYQLPSKGDVQLDGAPVRFNSLHEGEMAGIVMIHQEFNLAEQLTVEQNIFLGRELKRGPLLDKAEMRRRTRDYLDRVACNVSPDALVSSLSNSDKQMVEIAKALSRDARVLIMDEPTAVLTKRETDVLFKQQSNWARAEDPRPALLQIAKLAGFTQESFEACLKNQELLTKVNETRKTAAEVYGVSGTPSFFINGEKYSGPVSVDGLSGAIDALL